MYVCMYVCMYITHRAITLGEPYYLHSLLSYRLNSHYVLHLLTPL